MLAHAFARIEAARLAPITYVTLVWGVVFGFLFFAEVPGLATMAGAALIVLGTLVTQRRVRPRAVTQRPGPAATARSAATATAPRSSAAW